jgi:poly(beta-D-mannuronate) lyase
MKHLLSLVGGLLLVSLATAAELSVANAEALNEALTRAKPGDTLVLADGSWKDTTITVSTAGSADAPLTIRARTPGKVVLTGTSSLTLAAPHVHVSGLVFKDGALPKGGALISFKSDDCVMTDTAVIDYNPAKVETGYYWVFFQGNRNRIERCYFSGKSNDQPVIGNGIRESRYNAVVYSYFKDIPYVAGRNGREIFRIWGWGGNEEMGEDGAFFTVEHNLFDRADGEGMEIVSLKSNRNTVRHNTVINTRGGITNRSGNFNTITDNVLLCDGSPGAYGMRVTGRNHTIARNYIRGGEFGLHLMAGEFIERDLTGSYKPILREGTALGRVPAYNHPKDNLVADNVLVDNTGIDFLLGNGYKSNWPQAQRVLLPEQNRFTGNLVFKPKGGVAFQIAPQDKKPPLDIFTFGPNTFEGNFVLGGTVTLEPAPEGVRVGPATGPAPAPPATLTPADVGPSWMRSSAK